MAIPITTRTLKGFILVSVGNYRIITAFVDLDLPSDPTLPPDVREFLREANHRIERYRQEYRPPAFVPSDFAAAYAALRALEAADLAPGRWLC